MPSERLQAIERQILQLTHQEKLELLVHVLERRKRESPEQATEIDREITEARRLQRMWWMKTYRAEYGGQYIVLDGDQLIRTAKSYHKAMKLARASGKADLFVDYLPKPDEKGYMGGWL